MGGGAPPGTLAGHGPGARGPQSYAAGAATTYCFTAATDTPLVVSHDLNCHVIGCDGRLRASYQQLVSPGSTAESGLRVHAGETVYLVHRPRRVRLRVDGGDGGQRG
jgi:hypothetical protein